MSMDSGALSSASKPESAGLSKLQIGTWLYRLGLFMAFALTIGMSVYPFLIMTSIAFTPEVDVLKGELIPAGVTTEHFSKVFEVSDFGQYYLNTIFIAGSVTFLQVLTSAMAAYAFARMNWWGRDKVFFGYLATMMLPGAVTMVPLFLLFREMNLLDSYLAIILPGASTAFGTFLLRQFFLSIPRSLEEAAMMDGAGHFYIFTRIILPLAKPALSALTLLTFMGSWKAYLWPMIVMRSTEKMPLYVGLAEFKGAHGTDFGPLMAASLMGVLPVIAVFFLAQKYFIEGLQLGGVKG